MRGKKIKAKNIILSIFLATLAVFLTGCEFAFFPSGVPVTISGYVTYENQPLSGVKIRSDFYVYTQTDENGFYSFTTTSKQLEFYAKKTSYTFLPKVFNINDKHELYNFEASKAEILDGTLTLSQILISPTSIVSISDNNFAYLKNGNPALKLASFVFEINKQKIDLDFKNLTQPFLIEKNIFENVLIENQNPFELEVEDGIIKFQLSFLLKTYYKHSNFDEHIDEEKTFKFLNVSVTADTGDLTENNQIKFIASGINSTNFGFTYNIQFVFDYTAK